MKAQYHIIIKDNYFKSIHPFWSQLSRADQNAIRNEVIEGLRMAPDLGKHIFARSEDVVIKRLDFPRYRVIRSLPAAFPHKIKN